MSILAIHELLRRLRVRTVSAWDVLNWVSGSIDIMFVGDQPRVWTGSPGEVLMDRDCPFGQAVRLATAQSTNFTKVLREGDVKDRFRSRGRLWLVLASGQTVAEETVRVQTDRCVKCSARPAGRRETRLWRFQSWLCESCFAKLIPDAEYFGYVCSTWNKSLVYRGHRIHYDPVAGTTRYVQYDSDTLNRLACHADRR